MKKYFLIGLAFMMLAACNTDDQQSTESNTGETSEEVSESPYESMPDFPMPLQTFIENYNELGWVGYSPIEDEEFTFEEVKYGYKKRVLEENDNGVEYLIQGMFDEDKNFKGVVYSQSRAIDKTSDKANASMFTVLETFGIDTNYIFDFFDSGEVIQEISSGDYLMTIRSIETTEDQILSIEINGIN